MRFALGKLLKAVWKGLAEDSVKGPGRERVTIEQRNAFNRAREEKPGC